MWYVYVKINGEWRLTFTLTSLRRWLEAVTPYYLGGYEVVTYEFRDGFPTETFS